MTRHTDYLAEFDLQLQVTGTDDEWSVHAALRFCIVYVLSQPVECWHGPFLGWPVGKL